MEKLLQHVEPWQIFVADNGSSPAQIQETEFACDVVSEKYRLDHPEYVDEGNINFGRYVSVHVGCRSRVRVAVSLTARLYGMLSARYLSSIREGSKTMAQFCTAYNILSTYPHIKYVTMLDDDTLVPDCT